MSSVSEPWMDEGEGLQAEGRSQRSIMVLVRRQKPRDSHLEFDRSFINDFQRHSVICMFPANKDVDVWI
ncbi:Hypothetical protein SMAX5B_016499 [Scophthalmus maximus]|uniref:Uncharacterized protein n=1 Tax=Scophthalmus maximus TaxID=52904 RepID=A0A2U9C4Y3_SCOMX|nr:Hypothetical protein SMAX5B_016499 [Scophthalmus maximus]KAF0040200.1 hypothetical protein F2P81_008435 [Scophthalmus maximus]